jgi:hypothetical protein
VEIGETRYNLALEGGRLKASIALVVHGVALNTKEIAPAEWFARLRQETQTTIDRAQSISSLLSSFMAS